MNGPLLLILSAFLHALWNAFIKKSESKEISLFYIITFATLFSVVISPWTGGLKWGSALGIQHMIVAGLFEGGYFVALTKTLQKAPLGIGYALMRGGAMVFVWIISVSFLGEELKWTGFAAILLIILGIYLVHPTSKDKISFSQGFLWALAAAFFIAGYHIFYGFALKEGASQTALFSGSMLVSFPVLALQAGRKLFEFKKVLGGTQKYVLIAAGCISAASFILFLYGLVLTSPGVAISLRNTSVAFAQMLAFLMGEKLSKLQWAAVSCIFVGTLCLA